MKTIKFTSAKCCFLTALFLALVLSNNSNAQLTVINPSFEGTPQAHVTPAPWHSCMQGQTPDTQPGIWGITLPPTDGSSYVGFVTDSSGWQEGCCQPLSSPMNAGVEYYFTIDLARSDSADGGITGGDIELLVYGGWGYCDTTELLWSSGNVPLLSWMSYIVSFIPSDNYTHILLLSNKLSGSQPYLLVDNMSYIYEILQDQNICIGQSAQLFAIGGISYLWTPGNSLNDSTISNPVASPTTTTTYYVTITDTTGSTIDSVTVFVNPLPSVDIGIDTAMCEISNFILDAGNPGSTYNWSTGETTQTIQVYNSGIYYVTVTNTNGCQNSDNINIFVQYPYSYEEICMVIVDTIINKNLVVWEKTLDVGTEYFIVYKESTMPGVYDSIGFVPYDSISIFVDYYSYPIVHSNRYKIAVVDSCKNKSEKSPHYKTIHLTTSDGMLGNELSWANEGYEENGAQFMGTYYIYKGTSQDNFTLIDSIASTYSSYTDITSVVDVLYYYRLAADLSDNPCDPTIGSKIQSGPYSQSFSNIVSNIFEGIAHTQIFAFELSIYPNPFTNKTTIKFSNPENKSYKLVITDVTGKIVKVIENINTGKVEIKKGNLSSGFYMIELIGEKVFRGRMIIE